MLGEVISAFLHQRGYPTTVSELIGGRAELVDSLANGDVDGHSVVRLPQRIAEGHP